MEMLSNKPRVREVSFEHSFFFEKILRFIFEVYLFFSFFLCFFCIDLDRFYGGGGVIEIRWNSFDPCNYYFSLFY